MRVHIYAHAYVYIPLKRSIDNYKYHLYLFILNLKKQVSDNLNKWPQITKRVIRGIGTCRFICTTQGRDSYPGCEILFHMYTVAQVLKQPLHSNDVMVGPIAPWEVVKFGVTDDEGQTSTVPLLFYWINLQNKGKLNASHFFLISTV